jgi:hypothetical protein
VYAAAACFKHPAGYADIISLFIIIYLFIYLLVPAAAACFTHLAHDGGHCEFIKKIIIYSLFSACSASMRQASCGSMIPPIINHFYYFIYYLVSAAAACVKHPAGHANIIC